MEPREATRSRLRLCCAACALLAWAGLAVATPHATSPQPGTRSEAEAWLDEAYRLKSLGDLAGAALAFESARSAGLDPQRVALELAYLAAGQGDAERMVALLEVAAGGPDAGLAAQARAELRALRPLRTWRWSLYAESFAWWRLRGSEETSDLVPTVRLLVLHRPWRGLPLELYGVVQATRDLASRPATAVAGARVLADNSALLGGGLLLRPWPWLGAFVQAAGAAPLADEGRSGLELDLRAGAFGGLESSRCAPTAHGAQLGVVPCAELYGEAVWLSRFRGDVVGLLRGRVGAAWLVTGPVAWQLVAEARGVVDTNRDWYDNLADAGLGHRWRLAGPVRTDLMLSVHAGRFLGVAGRDPAPARLDYTDLRLELAVGYEP